LSEDSGVVPIPILRKIEEKYESDVNQLDAAYTDADVCARKGNDFIETFLCNKKISLQKSQTLVPRPPTSSTVVLKETAPSQWT